MITTLPSSSTLLFTLFVSNTDAKARNGKGNAILFEVQLKCEECSEKTLCNLNHCP